MYCQRRTMRKQSMASGLAASDRPFTVGCEKTLGIPLVFFVNSCAPSKVVNVDVGQHMLASIEYSKGYASQ